MKRIVITLVVLFAIMSCMAGDLDNKKSKEIAKPINITKAEFVKKVYDYVSSPDEMKYLGDKPAIVDFYADWCGPCRKLAPVLADLAKEYGDKIVIYKVNTDNEKELAKFFGITSLPTLLFIPMEGKATMAKGAMPKAELKKEIDKLLK